MAGIDWVGFDMDYTLAIYNQAEMDKLSIQATVKKLSTRGYPPDVIQNIAYPIDFPIRGLLIDKRFGHILKMDRFKVVQQGYHGLRELSKDEIRALYQSKKIRPTTARYHWIDTLYALSEATMYTGIVDAFEARGLPSTSPASSPTSASASTRPTATAPSSTSSTATCPATSTAIPSWRRRSTSSAAPARSSSCSPTAAGSTPSR